MPRSLRVSSRRAGARRSGGPGVMDAPAAGRGADEGAGAVYMACVLQRRVLGVAWYDQDADAVRLGWQGPVCASGWGGAAAGVG